MWPLPITVCKKRYGVTACFMALSAFFPGKEDPFFFFKHVKGKKGNRRIGVYGCSGWLNNAINEENLCSEVA